MAPVWPCPRPRPRQMVCSCPSHVPTPGPRTLCPATPEFPSFPGSVPFLQLLDPEPVTCSASMAAAASSTRGGSPSAAASPGTRATSASWTSAGNTVATEAPARPPPLVRPSALLPSLLPLLGPLATSGESPAASPPVLPRFTSASPHASRLQPVAPGPSPQHPVPSAGRLPPGSSEPCSPRSRAGAAVGPQPRSHVLSRQACPRAGAPRASRAQNAPSRCVRATVPTTAPALSTRATSPSADVYLASWGTAASTVSEPSPGPGAGRRLGCWSQGHVTEAGACDGGRSQLRQAQVAPP